MHLRSLPIRSRSIIPSLCFFLSLLSPLAHGQGVANDHFAQATVIANPLPQDLSTSNVGATIEVGEPRHDDTLTNASLWWRWTSPSTGRVGISTSDSSFDTVLAVYTGSDLATLTPEVSNDEAGGADNTSAVVLNAVAGETYSIAVASWRSTPPGEVQLHLYQVINAPNDAFSSATVLSGDLPIVDAGSTYGATIEPGEFIGAAGSVWWRWTPTVTSDVMVQASGSATSVTLYTGSTVGALAYAGSANQPFHAVAGVTYRLRVARSALDPEGPLKLVIRRFNPPPNDAFAAAITLDPSLPIEISGTTEDGTIEASEPYANNYASASSVWYRWTPATSGAAEFLVAPDLDPQFNRNWTVTIYTGAALSGLVQISESNNFSPFYYQAGTTYRIQVRSPYYLLGKPFTLRGITGPSAPANDFFSSAEALGSLPVMATGSIAGSTREVGEPQTATSGTRGSVWFRWTAAVTGSVGFTADPESSTRVSIEAFVGTSAGTLTAAPLDAAGRLAAIAGTTYRFRVTGSYSRSGAGEFTLQLAAPPTNDALATATVLSPTLPVSFSGTTFAASRETNEPASAPQTIWFSWTPASTLQVTVQAHARSLNGRKSLDCSVGAWAGASVATLTMASGTNGVSARFTATAGVPYRIRIATSQVGEITGFLAPTPANDNYTSPSPLTGSPRRFATGTLTGATTDHLRSSAIQPVWYSFTPATATPLVIHAASLRRFPLLISLYQSLSPTTRLARSTGGDLTFTPTAGVTYLLSIDSHRRRTRVGLGGEFTLSVQPVPANDDFANATALPAAGSGSATGWTEGATQEDDEPTKPAGARGFAYGSSIWYRLTPSTAQLVTLDTEGSGFDTLVRVFTGSSLTTLTLLRECDNATPTTLTSRLSFAYGRAALEGTTSADASAAVNAFAEAVIVSPNDPTANLLLGLSRLARMQHQAAFTTMLTGWGFTPKRVNLVNPQYDVPRDANNRPAPTAGANTSAARTYGTATVLPELTAFDASAAKVTNSTFALALSDSETKDRTVSVDYADVLILRSMGQLLRSVLSLNNSWNTDIPLASLFQVKKGRRYDGEALLTLVPGLLTKRTGTDERAAFKTAFQQANTHYQTARTHLLSRATGPFNEGHLFHLSTRTDQREINWAGSANQLSAALNGPTTWAGKTIDLRPLLTTATSPRSLLPALRETKATAGSASDPTFLGAWSGGTLTSLDSLLRDNRLLHEVSSFSSWAALLLGNQSLADRTPTADPDGDGLDNFTEYVFDLHPTRSNGSEEYRAEALLNSPVDNQKHLTFSFIRLRNVPGLSYNVRLTDDFQTWDATESQIEPVGTPVTSADGVTETVTYRVRTPATSGRKYVVIRASAAP
jgi:hypothetical protein